MKVARKGFAEISVLTWQQHEVSMPLLTGGRLGWEDFAPFGLPWTVPVGSGFVLRFRSGSTFSAR